MCAYHIYQSNTLEGFVEKYSHKFLPESLFDDSLCLVVQNRNMGEWLKLELARIKGICGDFSYFMPENALREFCSGYPAARNLLGEPEKPVLFLDNMKLILYQILRDLMNRIQADDPVYGELFRYVHSGDPENPKELNRVRSGRLFDLADSIAGLFNHYGMNCQVLISPWEEGKPYGAMPEGMRKHELWQRHLWNLLFDSDQTYLHLSKILSVVMKSREPYDGAVRRVVIFGSSFLGDTGLNFFHHLSKDIEVDHFILSPSRTYSRWKGDVAHPLLKSWSTLIGGFATLSERFDKPDRQNEYIPVKEDSLLHILQSDILEDRLPDNKRILKSKDHSFSIHTFTSRWREVEVLKDLILNSLNRDPSLNLTEVCILAPDINEYVSFLDALFPSQEGEHPGRDHLPYNIIDLNGTSESPYIQGFLQLFFLPGEKFTRKDLFLLFDNPCFCEAFQINRDERDFWLDLCESLNIKWGLDRSHKQDFFPEATDFNSWEEGFRRLRDGFFLEERDDPGLPWNLQDETGNQSAGKLMDLVEGLFHDFYELNRINLPLEKWVLLAEALMESYLVPRDGEVQDSRDRWRLKGTFRDLISLSEETLNPEGGADDLNFPIFRTLLTEFVRKSGGERGRYLTQGVTCSSLKPLRAIPFKRIYVLGLNEGVFPGEDLQLSFDLRELVQQTIDLSRRGSDKYAFLETLLSASEALTLFYHDRDPVRGETLQPSVLISELLEYLDGNFSFPEGQSAQDALVSQESIHNYDSRYFSGSEERLSFNQAALKSAGIAALEKKEEPPRIGLNREVLEKPAVLTLRELEQFLGNPGAYYYRKALGIYLEDRDNREEESQENWESPFLDRYLYLKGILDSPAVLDDPEALDRYLADQQIRGSLPDSQLVFLEKDFYSDRLEEIRKQLEEKGISQGLADPRDYLISPEDMVYQSYRDESLHPPVIIPRLDIVLPDGSSLSLSGLLEELSPSDEREGEWMTLEYCESGEPSVRHYMKSFIKSLIMHALWENRLIPRIDTLKLFLVGKRSFPCRVFSFSDSAGAEDVLLREGPDRLSRLLMFCRDQVAEPLMVYPELGEVLAENLASHPDMTSSQLADLFTRIWLEKAEPSAFSSYSPFAQCLYRRQFMETPPETDPDRLKEFVELVYLPFFSRSPEDADG